MRKKNHKVKKINSVSDFLYFLGKDLKSNKIYWFRGHSNFKWKLLPFIARRRKLLQAENHLIARFKQNATLLVTPTQKEYEWLTIMQHYGIPTRLLDWTESPLAALYFAAQKPSGSDGAVWVLSPCDLNDSANIPPQCKNYIPSLTESIVEIYMPSKITSEQTSDRKPIAVIGPRNTTRMQAQLGVFTVIHRKPIPIEVAGKKSAWKYIVPKKRKHKILQELSLLKIGKFQLFPELQSIGDKITEDME